MSIELGKDSIDIGIVVRDGEAALKFYRDRWASSTLPTRRPAAVARCTA